ncbi:MULTISPECIES: methyl-accepting chemotaxis protein [Shewanella]|jgi:methyl-accepting chemotaxis protein|uniref:HAMP domain-containing protein n=1 Tax=Shewanella chilikensis TaxID=558541 RepID=A0A6G7LXD2_9GAMM|nr:MULTISPECIES: methyl-accepting chemotaxis protein [Shewanella]MBZ4679437.1 chemotaxis protein [Shewanella sp.]MCA0950878.1 methyl-accepting chemotaxis protein [Shewanella chilikensis]MCE9851851.1 methyl-accepting chemotaxis protein [Shewanella chilikensis]MCL1161097.1 methyl-accepting chemotaxis protein [Shewanella chilikensis]QIJ06466.1 HAMP domain-containing protein [Shewanella chilikensis]
MINNTRTSMLSMLPSLLSSVLLIVIGIFAYRAFFQLNDVSERLVNNNNLTETFAGIREEFYQLRLASLVHNTQGVRMHQDKVHDLIARLSQFDTAFMNDAGARIAILKPGIDRYTRLYFDELALAERTDTEPVLTPIRRDLGPEVSAEINQLVAQITKRNQELGEMTVSEVDNAEAILLGLILFAIVTSLLMALLMSRHLVAIVSRIQQSVARLAVGDLTHKIGIQGKNELCTLAADLDQLSDRLQAMIREIAQASEHMAQQVGELNVQSESNSAALQAHALETDQVVTAVEEMSATAQGVANDAASAAQLTDKARAQGDESRQAVEQASNNVMALVSEVDCASQTIAEMDESTRRIAGVLDVIGEIAEQTNLLALNAAIEAARAGEQGRGFAVVADEVRALAARTQASTSEINNMLEQLRQGADSAVNAMNRTRQSCQATADTTTLVAESLQGLTEHVFDINGLSTQIATAAEEQSSVSEEITRNLSVIREMVEELNQSGKATLGSTAALAAAKDQLTSVVRQFKLN